jgi:hypothetical protein
MKKIFLFVLFVALLIAQGGTAEGHKFDEGFHNYDPKDVKIFNASKNLLLADKLDEAVKAAELIKDYELKWWIFYLIATNGYASRGDMKEAITLIDRVMELFREVTNISGREFRTEEGIIKNKPLYEVYDFEPYFQEIHHEFLEEVIFAAVKNGHWEKSLAVFEKISKPFYRLQTIEKMVLRLEDKKTVEVFLSRIGYELIHKHNFIYVYVYQKKYKFIVLWGTVKGREEVFWAFHKLTLEDKQELEKLQSGKETKEKK